MWSEKSECKFYLAYRVLYIIGMMVTPSPCDLRGSFLLAMLFPLCIFLPGFLRCSSLYENKKHKRRWINIVLRKMVYIKVGNYLMATRCFFFFSTLCLWLLLFEIKRKSPIIHNHVGFLLGFLFKITYGLLELLFPISNKCTKWTFQINTCPCLSS